MAQPDHERLIRSTRVGVRWRGKKVPRPPSIHTGVNESIHTGTGATYTTTQFVLDARQRQAGIVEEQVRRERAVGRALSAATVVLGVAAVMAERAARR